MEDEIKSSAATKETVESVRAAMSSDDLALPSVERLRQSGPFTSQEQFVNSSLANFGELVRLGDIQPDFRVLDYGCGLGRLTIPLRTYLSAQGSYVGVDIDTAAINYLAELHTQPSFEFRHVDIFSKMYNRKGGKMAKTLKRLELGEPFDLSFLFSVFTHILPKDVPPLLSFLKRTLAADGRIVASFFVLNEASIRGIDEGTSHRPFPFPIKGARIDNKDIPEGAVAYTQDDLYRHVEDAGLRVARFSQGKWSGQVPDAWHWQDTLVLAHR